MKNNNNNDKKKPKILNKTKNHTCECHMQIVTAFPKAKSWNSVSGKKQQYGFKDEFTPTNNLFAKKVQTPMADTNGPISSG